LAEKSLLIAFVTVKFEAGVAQSHAIEAALDDF
jgi:hypothetical protein